MAPSIAPLHRSSHGTDGDGEEGGASELLLAASDEGDEVEAGASLLLWHLHRGAIGDLCALEGSMAAAIAAMGARLSAAGEFRDAEGAGGTWRPFGASKPDARWWIIAELVAETSWQGPDRPASPSPSPNSLIFP